LSRILLVSKPLGPPWNDSSKNLVRDLAAGLTRYEARALGRKGGAGELGRVLLEPLYPAEHGGFSPALRDNARVLLRLLGGARADLFHFFFAPNPRTSRAARLAARIRRTRTLQTVCSVPRDDVALEDVLFGDRIVVLSRHTEARFIAHGIARERVVRIAPAAPPLEPPTAEARVAARRAFGLEPEAPLVIYPGDLEFGNGARLVVEAHAALPGDVELVLACRAKTPAARAIESALRTRARELGTAERTTFLGETPRILDLLGAADVVALPSDVAYAKMDYPLVLLEAMALARPVVVAHGTPAAELAEEGGALAVAPDAASLTHTLARLVAEPAERARLGVAARNQVLSAHGRERMAAAYELLYDALLS
jgi:glycosyltransferase involved in cell wall biosynthesis